MTLLLWLGSIFVLYALALTSFLFVVNKVLRRPLTLYPDEVSRFWTKRWVSQLINPAGLAVEKTHFGLRDLFTYVILVASRSRHQ